MAAETLASAGHKVDIFDRMPTAGRKFLMAGIGGLNISHTGSLEDITKSFFKLPDSVRCAIEAFPPSSVIQWVEGLGEPIFIGSNGKIFPKSFKASPLLRAWLRRLQELGVEFHSRHNWMGFDNSSNLLFNTLDDDAKTVSSDATLLAMGGASWPRLGSKGNWTSQWIKAHPELHVFEPFQPSNMGINISWSDHLISGFAGQPLKAITVTLSDNTMPGEVVVTKYGLEGPAIYALSASFREQLARASIQNPVEITLDLRPALSLEEIQKRLDRGSAKQTVSNRLRRALKLTAIERVLLREHSSFTNDNAVFARLIKALPFKVSGHQGLERAISSAGGVDTNALDENLMSKKVPGLFVAGEMLNYDAPTGGYLLQATLSTGRYAGENIVKFLAQHDIQPTSTS